MTEQEAAFWAKRCAFPYLPEPIGEFEVNGSEVPVWLRKVGQWDQRLLHLETLKEHGGSIVIAGRSRLEKGVVLYLFGLRGVEETRKIRSTGLILLPLTIEAEAVAARIMFALVNEFESLARNQGAQIARHYETEAS